jgi:hypothetical protein
MKRTKIGDIVEISTSLGYAYAQYTHKNPQYGALLTVLPGFYNQRPENFEDIVGGTPRFLCFFLLAAAVNQKMVSVVDHRPVPEAARAFPIFRAGQIDFCTGTVANWWLWDGVTEWPVLELDDEQKRFPVRGIWNHAILVERLESGFSDEMNMA